MKRVVNIILPAHDEAGYLGAGLSALLASDPLSEGWRCRVIVVANGCRDETADIARGFAERAAGRGWHLQVIEIAAPGKLGALNAGDAAAGHGIRIYLDADVIVSAALLRQLTTALDLPAPRHASGTPRIRPARSRVTRAYARFWQQLPFLQSGTPGFGIFAVNEAGRQRWGDWPDIISDDTFARLNFAPDERITVPATYEWPMVEGFARLVRVRRRQDAGVAEIAARFPELMVNDDKRRLRPEEVAALGLRDPVGLCIYGAVAAAVKTPLFPARQQWARGR